MIDSLKELNLKLILQIDELRKENAEVKAENTRLKQAIEENAMLKIRFEELEKKNKTDTAKLTAENAELKGRVTKLEQQTQVITNDQDASSTKDILQSTACSELSVNTRSRDESKGSLSIQFPIEGQSDKEKDNNPDHLPELEHSPTRPESLAEFEMPESSLLQDTINDDLIKILEFVETRHKENISNEIRERNKEKKLQSQGSMQSTFSSSIIQNNKLNFVIDTHKHKTTQSESTPTDQAQNTGIKIPYNKRVKQDLRHDLSVFKANNDNKINNVFDVQIPEFSLEVIITGSAKVTAQNIADLFILAIKVRQKEILCWYCYYKAYENRIDKIKHINKIDDQTARTLVYNEIKTLLPDITDVNLRQKTFRAKKIYILLTEIGVEKVRAVTCSASAISGLTNSQIQDIINCFPKNSNVDASSTKCQKMIAVTNCNAHVIELSNSKDISK
ncbi:16254_t:CDS:2, partial [Gigaspora margarita]